MIIHTIPSIDAAALSWGQKFVGISPMIDFIIRASAEWLVYSVPLALVILWFWYRYGLHKKDWHDHRVSLIEFALAGIVGWQVLSGIVKAFIYRDRPWVASSGVKELLFHRPNNSFPSDHSAFFFGLVAFSYLMGWKRLGNWMLFAAILVSFARIATGIHWLTDILAGALVGVLGGWLMFKMHRPFSRFIAEPIERALARIGL